LGMLRDTERDSDPAHGDPILTEADEQIIERLRARFRSEKDKP